MTLFSFSLLFVCIIVVFSIITANKLEGHSFQPPFKDVDSQGTRNLGPFWRVHGKAVVNTNFIRVTPDRQSKKGALWTSRPLGVSEFSTIMKFRISGQGKTFFGDGLSLWMTHQSYYEEGELHGSTERFYGVGIIFDTFKNTENSAAHRDVTILINDGHKTYEMLTENSDKIQGCSASVRYHAKRDDFSVSDASRVKVVVNGVSLEISIDPKNSGEWTECVKIPDIGLDANWLKGAFIGVSASTGQLADNHDVMSIQSYTDQHVMEAEANKELTAPLFSIPKDTPSDHSLQLLTAAVNDLLKKYELLDHHMEHKFVAVADNLKNLLKKLGKKEEDAEERIKVLEGLAHKVVNENLHPRINGLESQVHANVNQKMFTIEEELDRKIRDIQFEQSKIIDQPKQSPSSWHIPFFILLILIIASIAGMWMFYQKIKKMHLL